MVKTSHRHFVKQERNKVKLKGKKVLPKGLNRTDTSFKVKKIIIKEQLKEHDPSEILSKKKLNVKGLVSRLTHHNSTMQKEALAGLKEVVDILSKELLARQLYELIEAVANLTIDRESSVRSDALKLLSGILNKVSVDEMLPLFPVLSSYLICAMTHLQPRIREDSLKMLDILMQTMPQLVASHANDLLPRFLDLISTKSANNSRNLSLHLEGKLSTEKWRVQVLFRLQKLLTAIKDYNFHNSNLDNKSDRYGETGNSLKWEKNVKLHAPIYSDYYFQKMTLRLGGFESVKPTEINESKVKLKEYAAILVPLLLATFVEVAPFKFKDDADNQHHISLEAAVLLQCIVNIILILLELVRQFDASMLAWFRNNYQCLIYRRLVGDMVFRFPYTTESHAVTKGNKPTKEAKALLTAVEGTQSIDKQCLLQNLGISHLVLLLSNSDSEIRQIILSFLKTCLQNCGSLNEEQCSLLQKCLETVCTTSSKEDSKLIVKSVASLWSKYNKLDRPFSWLLFEFLGGVVLNYKLSYLHSEETFEEWLRTLPELLTRPNTAYRVVKQISQISTRNIPAFSDSLDGWIELIIDNVVAINITDCTKEEAISGKRDIVSLLYWIKDWDEEMINNFQKGISNLYFADLTSHLVDVLHLRAQREPEGILAKVISQDNLTSNRST